MNDMTANIDSLLDSSIDDLCDLPEFKPYPAGAHKVFISFKAKDINGHPSVEVSMKAIETLELANPNADQPLQAGAETSVAYMLDNEMGQGKLKEFIKPLAALHGVSSIRQVIELSEGMEVTVVTKVRQNKDKSASYTDISKLIV